MRKQAAPAAAAGPSFARLLFRFATGQHLDGRKRSDATFFRRGTHADPHYWGRGGESWWALLPGWQRSFFRVAPLLTAYEWATHRETTEWALAVTLGPLSGWLAFRGARAIAALEHQRTKVLPLNYALGPVLGIPGSAKPSTWLDVPADYGTRDDAEIRIYPPREFTGSPGERTDIRLAVTAKLGIEAPDENYKLTGTKPVIVLTKSAPPPDRVGFADIKTAVDAAAAHEIVMGIGKKDQVTDISLDNDSPHIGLSMESGGGKSVTARNMGAQMLHHGCLLMVLDYKLISHMWARGLPNVAYAGEPWEIESCLVWLAAEVQRRNQVALSGADIEGEVHADVGPRVLVIAEELNSTQSVLRDWWRGEMGMKGRSPGSEALDRVMFLGRQVRINVLQIGQRLSVKATGSGDARENLGVLVFADPTASAWKMLVGDRHALPPASGHKGRLQVVTKKTVRETQGAYLTGQQAHDFALSGVVAQPRRDMPCVTRTSYELAVIGQQPADGDGGSEQPVVVGQTPPVLPGSGGVTLRTAVTAGMFRSIEAARKAASRQGWQPVGGDKATGYEYALTDLHAYTQSRGQR